VYPCFTSFHRVLPNICVFFSILLMNLNCFYKMVSVANGFVIVFGQKKSIKIVWVLRLDHGFFVIVGNQIVTGCYLVLPDSMGSLSKWIVVMDRFGS